MGAARIRGEHKSTAPVVEAVDQNSDIVVSREVGITAELAGAHATHVGLIAAHDDVKRLSVSRHLDDCPFRGGRSLERLPLAKVIDRVCGCPHRLVQPAVERHRDGDRGGANGRPLCDGRHGYEATRRHEGQPGLRHQDLGRCRYALRIPRMTLASGMLQPLIQSVIEENTAGQQFLVVGIQAREAKGNGEQPGRLWREVQLVRIGAPNDGGKLMQGLIRQSILLEERVETAERPVMGQLDPFYIVGNGVEFLGTSEDSHGRYKEELGFGVDEPLDQPRACNAVDLWMLPSYPTHKASHYQVDARAYH